MATRQRAQLGTSARVQVVTEFPLTEQDCLDFAYIYLRVDASLTDLADARLALHQILEASHDGKTWSPVTDAIWVGDPTTVSLGTPCVGVPLHVAGSEIDRLTGQPIPVPNPSVVGCLIRGTLEIPDVKATLNDTRSRKRAFTVGVSLELGDLFADGADLRGAA